MMFMSAALTAQNYQFLYDYSFVKVIVKFLRSP